MAKKGYISLVLLFFGCLNLSLAASSKFASLGSIIGRYPFLRTNISQQPLVHTYSPWMRSTKSPLHLGYYPLRSFSAAPSYGYLKKAVQNYFARPAVIQVDTTPTVESILGQMTHAPLHHRFIIPSQTQNSIKNILSNPVQAKHFLEDLKATLSVQEEELEEVKADPWYANTVKQEMIEEFVQRLRTLDHFIKQKKNTP